MQHGHREPIWLHQGPAAQPDRGCCFAPLANSAGPPWCFLPQCVLWLRNGCPHSQYPWPGCHPLLSLQRHLSSAPGSCTRDRRLLRHHCGYPTLFFTLQPSEKTSRKISVYRHVNYHYWLLESICTVAIEVDRLKINKCLTFLVRLWGFSLKGRALMYSGEQIFKYLIIWMIVVCTSNFDERRRDRYSSHLISLLMFCNCF